jgi:hypothetical protein
MSVCMSYAGPPVDCVQSGLYVSVKLHDQATLVLFSLLVEKLRLHTEFCLKGILSFKRSKRCRVCVCVVGCQAGYCCWMQNSISGDAGRLEDLPDVRGWI